MFVVWFECGHGSVLRWCPGGRTAQVLFPCAPPASRGALYGEVFLRLRLCGLANILASEYFKSLHELKTVPEVIDELSQYAQHAEPYCSGSSRAPSTLFCCLYKLFTMKLTQKQVGTTKERKEKKKEKDDDPGRLSVLVR